VLSNSRPRKLFFGGFSGVAYIEWFRNDLSLFGENTIDRFLSFV